MREEPEQQQQVKKTS